MLQVRIIINNNNIQVLQVRAGEEIDLENENKSFTDTTVQTLSVLMLQGKQLVKRLTQDTKNTSFSHTTVHTFVSQCCR